MNNKFFQSQQLHTQRINWNRHIVEKFIQAHKIISIIRELVRGCLEDYYNLLLFFFFWSE